MGSTGAGTGGETYIVKSGDTLTKIAKQYGTTVKAIEAENNLTTTRIKVGQKLKIPAKDRSGRAAGRRACNRRPSRPLRWLHRLRIRRPRIKRG